MFHQRAQANTVDPRGPQNTNADTSSIAKDLAKDMHEGFKAVASPLLQLFFGGASLARHNHGHEREMDGLKLPPKPDAGSTTDYSVDRFRKDREILMAAINRQPNNAPAAQSFKMSGEKRSAALEDIKHT